MPLRWNGYIQPVSYYDSWQMPVSVSPSQPTYLDLQHPVEAKPHLILNFDMNKTLIASDKAGGKTSLDAVFAEIAAQVFDTWDDSRTVPVSYFEHVRQLFPNRNPSQDLESEKTRAMARVIQVLEERNHPEHLRMKAIYDRAVGVLERQKEQIFASFYKLIEFLREKDISYTLVIRTFGAEAPEIADELNRRFGSDFLTDFRSFKKGKLQGTESNLYDLVANTDHHLVIQDDWHWWAKHGQDWQYGKPFPIDLNDPQRISLFFDDNAKPDPKFPQKNIVAPYDAASGQPISPDELIKQGRLLPVDMLEALCDEDYYIRLVEKALQNP